MGHGAKNVALKSDLHFFREQVKQGTTRTRAFETNMRQEGRRTARLSLSPLSNSPPLVFFCFPSSNPSNSSSLPPPSSLSPLHSIHSIFDPIQLDLVITSTPPVSHPVPASIFIPPSLPACLLP